MPSREESAVTAPAMLGTALIRPAPLQAGDVVALVSPSSPADPTRLERGVALLASWGLEVVVGAHAAATAHRGILAGTDAQRAADFQDAWRDPQVRAVFISRGGYGAARLLSLVDWDQLATLAPKWLVGSSDVTALHAGVNDRLGVASVHGPMPASQLLVGNDPDPLSISSLRQVLFTTRPTVLRGDTARFRDNGSATVTGRLVGGNLTLLASLVGTAFASSARRSIVFLEDVDEAPYRIDRLLTQLIQSQWLSGMVGIALGDFAGCGDHDDLLAVFDDRLTPLGVPVVTGFAAGHGRPQSSLVLGSSATLDVAAATLSF